MPRGKRTKKPKEAQAYNHSEKHPQRPDIGTEAQFKKKKPPVTYRYDSSLAPELNWDDNPSREQGEAHIQAIASHLQSLSQQLTELNTVAESLDADSEALKTLYKVRDKIEEQIREATLSLNQLKALSEPFLNWTGKAERLSFDVPNLPLFVHERLSTRAIIETLKSHKSGGEQLQLNLFNTPEWSITDQILRAYEYHGDWVNRMILGDSLVTMNSLLQYEGLGGQVQMIYIDPPYGVKFGSNFQPFVRKRDVKHNDDDNLTREPEMVQAYRDTWELGLHSYLTYLRDRLLLARELLTDSGSVFVQISDENVHHVRELMDEVFGEENFVVTITFQKKAYQDANDLAPVNDFILWITKDKKLLKYNPLYTFTEFDGDVGKYRKIESPSGQIESSLSLDENEIKKRIQSGWKLMRDDYPLVSQDPPSEPQPFKFNGKIYEPPKGRHWSVKYPNGLDKLAEIGRIRATDDRLYAISYWDDNPLIPINNIWNKMKGPANILYVVQTTEKAIQRCLLMTTDPGDLVLDITCGSGTTAYVAEQWGRRWITCDVSRVPLALARQRLLTATFPWYQLKDNNSPTGGFIYKRKQNRKGEEIGGIVPHITLKSIANNETPDEEILVDRPEVDNSIVRVCSPFTIEGTIPPPVDMDAEDEPETEAIEPDTTASFTDRMLEVLRNSPVIRLPDNKTVTFTNVRQPAKTQNLSAEAMVNEVNQPLTLPTPNPSQEGNRRGSEDENEELGLKTVAFLFGPENGQIAERTIQDALKEAYMKSYSHLYIIGFAISPNARQMVEHCQETMNIPATYIQATPDLLMGDLLKNMRSSQIFSVCGLPEIKVHQTEDNKYQVELLGLDVFDPVTMEVDHEIAKNVPAWFLDTNYNGLCFHVNQAFFPRTKAWDSLKKALKGTYEESVWEHLSGTTSASFEAGNHQQIAVKVIDDRGNELLVVKDLKED